MIVPESTPAADTAEQFSKAKSLLCEVLKSAEVVQQLEDDAGHPNAKLVYTKAPTLWLLVLQRLFGGLSLTEAVKCLLNEHGDLLPQENRRVAEGTLSSNNSGFNKARQRIPLEVIKRFSHLVCNYLARRAEPAFLGQRVFILDGTTITLPPTPELKKAFPPAQNQHGESVWPVAMLLVAHELQTGCAMVPQIDPMYGPDNSSEAKQAAQAIAELPDNSIVMADSGFGIFQVAWSCKTHKKNFVIRLTNQRFKTLVKQAQRVEKEDEPEGCQTYYLNWHPSAHDRQANPHLPEDASIEVFIHKIELDNLQSLMLVSDIEVDGLSVGQLYEHRYDVEFDIRDVKVTMDTESLRAKSVDTVMKELLGSIIAFNIVTQFRRQAAKLINAKPRKLSFTGVWITFQYDLLRPKLDSYETCQLAYQRALINASKQKLPERKEKRNYPRLAHPRRQKTTKFKKKLISEKNTPEPPPPPN